jgi:16S rRNA (cytidine1402-2'-O)-methyltransferase
MGILYIIATPIGNLADLTERARETLAELDILACEDTRHTGKLFELAGIPRKAQLVANHEHNERQLAGRIVTWLDEGRRVGICSDAGYPLVSDPGYSAVAAAIAAGHEICVIPGASAVPMALISSGLPPSSYIFKGFPPRKPGQRRRFLEQDMESPHTLIFYESPFRIGRLLEDALQVYGDRRAAVCLELSKQFERVRRGGLAALCAEFKTRKIKGEAVVVIEGNTRHSRGVGDTDDGG